MIPALGRRGKRSVIGDFSEWLKYRFQESRSSQVLCLDLCGLRIGGFASPISRSGGSLAGLDSRLTLARISGVLDVYPFRRQGLRQGGIAFLRSSPQLLDATGVANRSGLCGSRGFDNHGHPHRATRSSRSATRRSAESTPLVVRRIGMLDAAVSTDLPGGATLGDAANWRQSPSTSAIGRASPFCCHRQQ